MANGLAILRKIGLTQWYSAWGTQFYASPYQTGRTFLEMTQPWHAALTNAPQNLKPLHAPAHLHMRWLADRA
jgi:hypothetical protein